jgi:hypothetical protein
MGAASSQSKQCWNADHYTQVKVSVAAENAISVLQDAIDLLSEAY